jgi:Domain of unknown function (DUF4249)
MKNIKSTIHYLLLLLGLVACIDPVEVPIRNVEQQLVVEGLITNETPPSVKLTYTGAFDYANFFPENLAVLGANVTISDDRGRSTRLRPDAIETGLYRSTDVDFVGQVGRTYTLTVILPNGKKYVSTPEPMQPVPVIESITATFTQNTGVQQPYAYQVFINTKDAPNTNNYYRWQAFSYLRRKASGIPCGIQKICGEFCWIPNVNQAINIFSDNGIDGNNIRNRFVLQSPVYEPGRHLVEVSQMSISREAFLFWKLYQEQRDRRGTIFDPQPASVRGNLRNEADEKELVLGFFGASAVTRKKLVIPGDTLPASVFRRGREFELRGDCRLLYPDGRILRPDGWPN